LDFGLTLEAAEAIVQDRTARKTLVNKIYRWSHEWGIHDDVDDADDDRSV